MPPMNPPKNPLPPPFAAGEAVDGRGSGLAAVAGRGEPEGALVFDDAVPLDAAAPGTDPPGRLADPGDEPDDAAAGPDGLAEPVAAPPVAAGAEVPACPDGVDFTPDDPGLTVGATDFVSCEGALGLAADGPVEMSGVDGFASDKGVPDFVGDTPGLLVEAVGFESGVDDAVRAGGAPAPVSGLAPACGVAPGFPDEGADDER